MASKLGFYTRSGRAETAEFLVLRHVCPDIVITNNIIKFPRSESCISSVGYLFSYLPSLQSFHTTSVNGLKNVEKLGFDCPIHSPARILFSLLNL